MSSVSDLTGAVVGVVLPSQYLEGVHVLLDLSHPAVRKIIFNFGWSAAYNIFAILLASGAFVEIPDRALLYSLTISTSRLVREPSIFMSKFVK